MHKMHNNEKMWCLVFEPVNTRLHSLLLVHRNQGALPLKGLIPLILQTEQIKHSFHLIISSLKDGKKKYIAEILLNIAMLKICELISCP
jgi:hypothetical protein